MNLSTTYADIIEVVWQKPTYNTYYEFAGLCLKCNEFPIVVEDIIFEKGDDTSRV